MTSRELLNGYNSVKYAKPLLKPVCYPLIIIISQTIWLKHQSFWLKAFFKKILFLRHQKFCLFELFNMKTNNQAPNSPFPSKSPSSDSSPKVANTEQENQVPWIVPQNGWKQSHSFPPPISLLPQTDSPHFHVLLYFVCFCHLSVSPLANNQAFLPIPTTSTSVLIPVCSLYVLTCAFLSPFSHLLLVFSLPHLPTAHTSFPPVCSQCQWHYSVAHGSGWLEYVMGSYQARQKTRKKESVTESREGNKTEKNGELEAREREFAMWIQILSFTLQYNSTAQLHQRKEYFLSVREARAYKGGRRKRQRDIETKAVQDTQPVYRERGSGKAVSPHHERRRGRIRKAEKLEVEK